MSTLSLFLSQRQFHQLSITSMTSWHHQRRPELPVRPPRRAAAGSADCCNALSAAVAQKAQRLMFCLRDKSHLCPRHRALDRPRRRVNTDTRPVITLAPAERARSQPASHGGREMNKYCLIRLKRLIQQMTYFIQSQSDVLLPPSVAPSRDVISPIYYYS